MLLSTGSQLMLVGLRAPETVRIAMFSCVSTVTGYFCEKVCLDSDSDLFYFVRIQHTVKVMYEK